jgi:hypothetical protein
MSTIIGAAIPVTYIQKQCTHPNIYACQSGALLAATAATATAATATAATTQQQQHSSNNTAAATTQQQQQHNSSNTATAALQKGQHPVLKLPNPTLSLAYAPVASKWDVMLSRCWS